MSPQQENELILNSLWAMGEEMFAGMMDRIHQQVVEAEPECEKCGGVGEFTVGRSDSDYGEVVKCECPAGRQL